MTHAARLATLRAHNWHEIESYRNRYTHRDERKVSHQCVWIEGYIGMAESSAYMTVDTGVVMLHKTTTDYEFDAFIELLTAKPEIVPPPVVQQDRQRSLFD